MNLRDGGSELGLGVVFHALNEGRQYVAPRQALDGDDERKTEAGEIGGVQLPKGFELFRRSRYQGNRFTPLTELALPTPTLNDMPSLIDITTSSKGGFDDQPKDRRYRQR